MAQDSDKGSAGGNGAAVPDILFVASVLLLLVVFAFGVVSLQLCFNACYRRRALLAQAPSRCRRGGGTAADGSGGSTQTWRRDPEAPRPLPAATVWPAAATRSEEVCTVCLAELEDGKEARFLPRCGHGFHAGCVGMWLASHSTCPLCRLTVAKPDVAAAAAPASALPRIPSEPANYALDHHHIRMQQ